MIYYRASCNTHNWSFEDKDKNKVIAESQAHSSQYGLNHKINIEEIYVDDMYGFKDDEMNSNDNLHSENQFEEKYFDENEFDENNGFEKNFEESE